MDTNKSYTMDFSEALHVVKRGGVVTRKAWSRAKDVKITMHMQVPDEHSKMTKEYLYMEKFYPAQDNGDTGNIEYVERFPLDLSAESIFAKDWYEVTK
jgi:hypothetical protein